MNIVYKIWVFTGALTCLIGLGALEAANDFLYVALSGENRIAVYRQDERDGSLERASDIETSASPKSLGIAPNKDYLFVSLAGDGEIAGFRIDPETGEGSLTSQVSTGSHASFIEMDASGSYLLSSYYSLGKIQIHRFDGGRLSESPLQDVATDERTHSIILDPSNRYAFVSHTRPDAIHQFLFDSRLGHVKENPIPLLQRANETGPRHLRFDTNGKYGYGSDEQGSAITVYRLNSANGQLSNIQALSSLPDGYDASNSTSDVRIHPSGRYVYIVNRGHDTIAAYAIDPDSGRVSFIDWVHCEANTRSIDFSDDGKFLYGAGSRSHKLAIYSVDAENGSLRQIETLDVGKTPWWTLFVSHDN